MTDFEMRLADFLGGEQEHMEMDDVVYAAESLVKEPGGKKMLEDFVELARKISTSVLKKTSTAKPQYSATASYGRKTGVIYPFGRSKGLDLAEVALDSLEYLLKATDESINDPSKSKWRERNIQQREAVVKELAYRETHP